MDNLGYLFAVYSVIWVVLFLYVLFLINGQKKLRKEIDSLKRELEEKRKG
jgi:CcmD family protein